MLKCYRFFKQVRNCLMHAGGLADQKCVDDYTVFAAVATCTALGVKEVPAHSPPAVGQPVPLVLRGVVGMTAVVRHLVVTLDAELARHKVAEEVFVRRWRGFYPGPVTLPYNPIRRTARVARLTKKVMGFPATGTAAELETFLKQRTLVN